MAKKRFLVTYEGDDPPSENDVRDVLLSNAMDEGGILTVEEVKRRKEKVEFT
jgi:hypothetical protein